MQFLYLLCFVEVNCRKFCNLVKRVVPCINKAYIFFTANGHIYVYTGANRIANSWQSAQQAEGKHKLGKCL